MGLFNKLFVNKTAATSIKTEQGIVYLPMNGEIIPLENIEDGVFSEGLLGPGCGIIPAEEMVYSFVNGTILTIASTKHAIGIRSEEGVELLLHIGMDTVEMKGKPFKVSVEVGQRVKCGDLLMSFDSKQIKGAGFVTTSAFVITNGDEFKSVELLATGLREKLTPCLKVER